MNLRNIIHVFLCAFSVPPDTDTFIVDKSPGCKDVKLYNYDSYLYNTDNAVMQTFGSVPLLSVVLLEAYMYLNSNTS